MAFQRLYSNDEWNSLGTQGGGSSGNTSPSDSFGILRDPVKYLLGGAMNVAQDVGTGIRNNAEQPNLQKNMATAKKLQDQAYATNDMQRRKALLQSSNQVLQGVGSESQNISRSFSPDVNQNPYWRAFKGATQVATSADMIASPMNFLAKKTGIPNPDVPFLPSRAADVPFLGTGKLLQGSGVKKAFVNHALHGGTEGAVFGLGQQGENLDPYSEAGYTTLGGLLEPLLAGASSGMVTEKGALSKIKSAAQSGRDIDWNKEVADAARQAAKDKPRSVRTSLEKILADEIPPENIKTTDSDIPNKQPMNYQYQGAPKITADQARELRSELGQRLQKDIFGRLKIPISSSDQQATDVLRRTVSQTLKNAAPDIKTPDAVYSFYKKVHGDAPTWAKRMVALELLKHIGSTIPGMKPLLDAIPVP